MRSTLFLFILLIILTGCVSTPYQKKDGKVVFDATGTCYRLRSYKTTDAKEIYYLDKLDIQMQVGGAQIKQSDLFK